MRELARLIAEAKVLGGGEHECAVLDHVWKFIGGRACPFHEDGCGNSSQAVHECEACGEIDYGTHAGEPGFDYCESKGFNCGGDADDRVRGVREDEGQGASTHGGSAVPP